MGITIVDMHRADTRTRNLWNGTFNDLPPSGWETVGYDDSAWPLSAVPGTANGSVRHLDTLGGGSGYSDTVPSGPEPVWPDSSARDAFQNALLRWHFSSPGGILDVDMTAWTAPGSQFDWIGFNTHSLIYINGFEVDDSSAAMRLRTVAGDNVVAIYVGDTHLPPAFSSEFWTTADAWLALRVQISATARSRSFGQVIG